MIIVTTMIDVTAVITIVVINDGFLEVPLPRLRGRSAPPGGPAGTRTAIAGKEWGCTRQPLAGPPSPRCSHSKGSHCYPEFILLEKKTNK